MDAPLPHAVPGVGRGVVTFDPTRTLATLAARNDIPFDAAFLPTSERLAQRDGPDLHYLRWSGQRGPLVVLLHGGALTAHTWDLVCMALSPDHRCIALDLRGHGETAWADSYRIEDQVEDVRALLSHLREREGDARVHLVGMSLGGNVAGHVAFTESAQLASLTTVDIAPGINRDGTVVMRQFLSEATSYPTVDALVEAAQTLSPRTDGDLLRYRYHHMTRTDASGWTWRGDRRKHPDFPHIYQRLTELNALGDVLTCPMLVAVGARSRVLSEEAARDFAGRFRNGRAVTIEGAGHNVQEDNPRALANALRAHFAGAGS
ncbi:MAG: alpha/beta hydrolase [Polyangiales bacterium]